MWAAQHCSILFITTLQQVDDFLPCTCEYLVKNGANVNAEDSEDRTPLHYAVMHNRHLVSVLISREANIFAVDENGKTPLDYAFEHGNIASGVASGPACPAQQD